MQRFAGILAVTTTTTPVPGAHQDPADLYGLVLGLVVIVLAIVVVRLVFRPRRRSGGPR